MSCSFVSFACIWFDCIVDACCNFIVNFCSAPSHLQFVFTCDKTPYCNRHYIYFSVFLDQSIVVFLKKFTPQTYITILIFQNKLQKYQYAFLLCRVMGQGVLYFIRPFKNCRRKSSSNFSMAYRNMVLGISA